MKTVSSDIQTLSGGLKKQGAGEFFFFFNQIQIVWISDEKLFWVFEIASQSINNC